MLENPLPGMNGGETLIWYRSATASTSGVGLAAAATRIRTDRPSRYCEALLRTHHLRRPHGVEQTAAITVVAGRGQAGLAADAHQFGHHRAECQQFSSSSPARCALLQHDGQLPLRQHQVVVQIVDLAARHPA